MGGFLPIYATGFWPPVMDVPGRIAVPAVHGYRLTVVLLEEFRREEFRLSVRKDTGRAGTAPVENGPVVLQQDDLEIRTETLVRNAECPLLPRYPLSVQATRRAPISV
jgi:hypothetical protein